MLFNPRGVILALALYLPAGAAFADEPSADDICAMVSEWAELIMQSRQAGIPMTQMMTTVGSSESLRHVVMTAYGRPLHLSDKLQKTEVSHFRDEWVRACYADLLND